MTLLELLIVIAMLLLLVSIVLMATSRNTKSEEKKITASTLALLDSALEEYKDFMGYFPKQLDRNIPEAAVLITHSELLYGELYRIPDSRKILLMVDESMIVDTDKNGLFEICDRWGTPLNYVYELVIDVFPLIVSAGPDKILGTADDITNRK